MEIFIGLLLPFIGTTLGSMMVFFIKKNINQKFEHFLLGFAAGVMIAASIWSLILPSIEMSTNKISYLPATIGLILGALFLLLLDSIIPHLHLNQTDPEGIKSNLKKKTMMIFAVTLHNIPEGMAVGVILAGAMNNAEISIMAAISLSIGIAIQNFPEGAIISMPLYVEGKSKKKAFLSGTMSGIVEPIAGIITVLLASFVTKALPYLLAFAAGAMIYVVVEELIPESQSGKHSNIAIIGLMIGFILMMILDIQLG